MDINEFSIVFHDEDLNRLIGRFAPPNNKIRNLRVECQDEKILFSGRIAQLLNIPFQATLDISHTENEIVVRLERIQPMRGMMGQFKEKILNMLAERADFIRHDKLNDALRIDVNKALAKHITSAKLLVKDCTASTDNLALTLQGELLIV